MTLMTLIGVGVTYHPAVAFAFPISAMTRDVGDSGDRAAPLPLPLPVHPTSSQMIPDWRRFQGVWVPDHPITRDHQINRSPLCSFVSFVVKGLFFPIRVDPR
jgi:hypothetical protein